MPVTATRINGAHNLCHTCTAVVCSRYGINVKQIRDLEWAVSTVRHDMIKKKIPGPVPPERVRAAIEFIENNQGLLKMLNKETS